ncbi:MAG: hypothetical protein J6X55_15850, partial [Victivallales bacterium]|nr:hypothetical protein [Victivallales bacterium]
RAVTQASGKKNAKGATEFLVVMFFLLIVLGAMIALVVSKQRSESASGQLNYELESGQKLNGSEAKPENTSPPTGNVSEPETRLPSRAETVGGDSTIADGRTTTIANSSGGKASVELQPVVEASAAAVVTTEQSTTDVKTDSEDSQETTGEETDGQAKTEAADSQEEADDTTLQAKNDGEENTATAKEAIRADHLLSYDLNNSQIEFMANLQLALLWLERSAPTIRLQNLHAFEEALKAYREQEDCPESQKASAKFVEEELLTGYRRLPTVLKERMQEIRQMSFTVDRETWNVQEFGDMDAKMSMVKVSKPGGSNHLPKDWATLQKRGIIAGICRQLIESGKHQLSEDTSLLASLALTGQIREYARLLKTYQLGEDDSFWILPVEWERFRENQKAERNALGLLQQIIVYADNDSIEGVYVKAGELTDKYSSTQLYAILSPMVQPLFENCKGICSAEKSKQLLKDSQNSLLENEISSPSEVYSPLMFWIARYGNPAQGSKIENKNERLLDNAIKRLAEDENYAPTSIDFVRAVPFLLTDTQERRADLSPTMAQKYLSENKEDAKKDKVFKRLDSQMSILARLEIGDWNYARKNNRQLQWKELDGMSVQELPDDGLPLSIASLYGRALLMARFEGDMDRADKSMAPLLKVNKSSRVAVAAYSAVLEYWLLTRRGQFSASDLPIPFAARSVLRNAMQAERQWQYDSKRKFAYLYLAALFESGLDSEALNLLKSIDKDKDDIVEKLDIKEHYQPYFTELIEIHEAATNDEDAEGNISQLEKKVAAFHDVKYTMEYFKAKFSACGERPLTGKRDRQFKDLFSKYLPFSRLIGGDVCWDWTLRRIAWELAEDNMENAMEVAEWVLEQQYASLIPYYGRLLALRAGLRLLQGRHDALLDATFLAEKATVLSDGEQKFFKSFASYPRIGDYKFKGTSRHQEYFWYQWLMACEQFGEKGKESSEFNALQGRREENALSERVLLTGLEKFIQKR